MTMVKRIAAVVAALCMGLALTACGGGDALVMATNANFPPYEYMEGDEYAGIDIEMAQEIAKRLGRELEIVNTEFGGIVTGVQTGKYDIGVAGLTITDERKEQVNFTKSYATGVQVVIVKAEGSKVATLDDLAKEGVKIGVQQDTTGHIYASDTIENGGYGEDAVTPYLNGADAVNALVTGKVDAVIIDNEPAKSFVAANTGLKILDTEWMIEDYAIAIGKDDEELLKKIDEVLDEMKADGTMKKIIDKYIKAE